MYVIIALCSACAFLTAKDLVSKSLASRVHPDLSTFASFLYSLPFFGAALVVLMLTSEESLVFSPVFLLLVLMRGISDVFAEGCKMRALEKGDVSVVIGVLSLSPLILTLISPFITGDAVHFSEFIGIALIVVGSGIIVKREKGSGKIDQPVALLYALAGSLAFAVNTALDKLAVGQAGPVTSAFSVTTCAALLTTPALFRTPQAKEALRTNKRLFSLRGFFEALFMIAKMAALVSLPAHIVAGITRFSMITTVIAGGAWFQEQDRARRFFGSLIMYVGLLALLF